MRLSKLRLKFPAKRCNSSTKLYGFTRNKVAIFQHSRPSVLLMCVELSALLMCVEQSALLVCVEQSALLMCVELSASQNLYDVPV
jgi:hypothetical protein